MQKTTIRLSCLLALLLLVPEFLRATPPPQVGAGSASTPTQQEGDIVVELRGDQRPRLRLALPAARVSGALASEGREAARELEATLRNDLEESGIFEVQGPEVLQVLELTGDRDHDFELYRSLANEVVLLADLRVEGSRLVLEGRVYDLKSGGSILGKLYRGEWSLARRIAHTFSDDIVLAFSGRRGIALTTLVFTSDRDDRLGNKELYLMDYDGHSQRRISGHKSITLSPTWSPTGDGIAYVSYFGDGPGIYFVDIEAGTKRSLVTDGGHNVAPTFSPDGRRIAFSRSLRGNSEIFVADRDGNNLERLTHSAGIDTNPAWSPMGREIAFTSSRSGSPQIYLMDVEGSNLRRVTYEGRYNDGAAWHPEGNKLTYAARSDARGRFDIVLVDLVTLESRTLTSGSGSHESPVFSPDGRRIAFELTRGGNTQIFVMDTDGANLRQLTFAGENFSPSWSNYLK